jgi:hypothetical protein
MPIVANVAIIGQIINPKNAVVQLRGKLVLVDVSNIENRFLIIFSLLGFW